MLHYRAMPKHRGKWTRHKDEGAKDKKGRQKEYGGKNRKSTIKEVNKCTRNRR
jgi:hypothetical protein